MTDRPRYNIRRKLILEHVEELHDQLKEAGEYRAPINVEKIAKSLGVKVTQLSAEDDDLSGFFYRDPLTGACVIGVNKDQTETRRRFTIAHELGHLKLHAFEDLHYDRRGTGGVYRFRDGASAKGEVREEIEANTFAAELLMPADLIFDKLEDSEITDIFERDSDTAVRTMAKEFNVSPQALSIRMTQLGILNIE